MPTSNIKQNKTTQKTITIHTIGVEYTVVKCIRFENQYRRGVFCFCLPSWFYCLSPGEVMFAINCNINTGSNLF